MKYHIERYREEDPEFVEIFLRSIYVDDLSPGAPESDTGYELYLKSKVRLAEGGFNLRKFVSNSAELMERIQCNESSISNPVTPENIVKPEHTQSSQDLPEKDVVTEEDKTYAKSMLGAAEDTTSAEQKVLGVRWNFVKDTFVFELREMASLARDIDPTKRNVVSIAAKFYRPTGVPVTYHSTIQIVLSRTLQDQDWLGRPPRRQVKEGVATISGWVARYEFICTTKMLFPRSL